MKVLHICNDFTGSKVHSNLYKRLDEKLESQVVYTYFDGKEKIGINFIKSPKTEIIYDDILNPYLRKIYPFKMWWVYRHLMKRINPSEIDCVHATTLFSDGGIAYKLYKKYGIPYIVAVRTTDLSVYIDKTKLLWPHGREILKHACKIVLINKAYREKMKNLPFIRPIWEDIKERIIIQPNGIDDFWIENVSRDPKAFNNEICYVGTFIKRKNIPRLIEAVDNLRSEYPKIHLNLIGGGGEIGNEEDLIYRMANERPYVTIVGRISDKNQMKEHFRKNSIFAMPSWGETFGLVYIEALTQNMRLLYAENDGIDGLIDNVGVAVNPYSVDSIAGGLKKVIADYDVLEGNRHVDFSDFDWTIIADRYVEIFDKLIRNN